MEAGDQLARGHSEDRLLLVEGKNDHHVVLGLLNARGLRRDFSIHECGSDSTALRELNARITAPDEVRPTALGVVLDANGEPASRRWQSVRDKLVRYPYALDGDLPTGGFVHPAVDWMPRLGVWVMPDNRSEGRIEDFCLRFLQGAQRQTAEDAVGLAEERSVANFKPTHRSKAVLHTYLAWEDEPGYPMGASIAGGRLDSRAPDGQGDRFVDWLDRLFELDSKPVG